MERFENTIDDVKEINLNIIATGFSDITPWADDHLDISVIRIGEEEHVYRFTGPGVKKFYEKFCENLSDAKIIRNNEKLRAENQKLREAYEKLNDENKYLKKENDENKYLKKENEDFGNQILDYIEMNRKLSEENKKEVHKVKELAADNDRLENKIRDLQVDNKFLKRQVNKTAEAVKNLQKENKKLKEEYEKKIKELEELKAPTIENFADEEPRTRADILDQAKKCVCGQREQDYGTPESNFQLIADLWNGYLGFMDHPQDQIRATDVAMMMALMKIARIRNGGGSGDSFVDLAGYAACGGEIWHGE